MAALAFLGLVAAAPAPSVVVSAPDLLQQYMAVITQVFNVDGSPSPGSNKTFAFSSNGLEQVWRREMVDSASGANLTTIVDFKAESRLELVTQGGVTKCTNYAIPHGAKFMPLVVAPDAVDSGAGSVSGIATEEWVAQRSGSETAEWSVEAKPAAGMAPALLQSNGTVHFAKNCPYTPSGGACTSSAVRDFAVTLKGPPPAWLFRAPAGRQCPPIAADALAGASLEGLLSFN